MLRSSRIVVIALLALTGCGDRGAPDGEPAVNSRATAGPETGDLLLHGELTRDGQPSTNGKVWVSSFVAEEQAQEGDVIPIWESAVASSDHQGRFAVSVDPEGLNGRLFNGEYFNYEINVLQDGSWATWSTTAYLVAGGVWRSDGDALVGDPVLQVAVDLDAPTITLTDSQGASETGELILTKDVPPDAVLP